MSTPPHQTRSAPLLSFKSFTGEATAERLGVSAPEFQDRVRRLSVASAAILVAAFAIRMVAWFGTGMPAFLVPTLWWHAAAVVPFAALWLYARGPVRSLQTMRLVETSALKAAVFAFAAMGAAIDPPFLADLIVTLALFFVVIVRVAFIPTTAGRAALETFMVLSIQTLVIAFTHDESAAEVQSAMALMVTDDAALGELHWDLAQRILSKAVWWFLIGLAAVIVARVVHGLRQQVVDARRLGQYTLVEPLGQGGMGDVWRARHGRLRRPTALKLLRAPSGGDQATRRARFEREAQATARLASPHTVQLFDYGHAEDGRYYYVMELLDGLDVRAFVERFGPVPPERVIHWLGQACHSLAEAHARGLVHRDIKPANVFVARVGLDVDFVKVLDFGLVRDAGEAEAGHVRLTRDGAVSGTPAYLSPEQILGRELDGRADLYGLGCIAYLALTGQDVFQAPTATAMCVAHASEAPVPPSQRAEVAIPEALEALVLALLAKAPADRPASAEAVRDALAAISVERPWTRERAARWWATHLPAAPEPEGAEAPSGG